MVNSSLNTSHAKPLRRKVLILLYFLATLRLGVRFIGVQASVDEYTFLLFCLNCIIDSTDKSQRRDVRAAYMGVRAQHALAYMPHGIPLS